MEKREQEGQARARERAQRRLEKEAAARLQEEEEIAQTRAKAFASRTPSFPRATHSYLIRTANIRSRLRRNREEHEREEQQEALRQAKERATGKALAEVMRLVNRQGGRPASRDLRDARRRARQSQDTYRQALKDNEAALKQVKGSGVQHTRSDLPSKQLRQGEGRIVCSMLLLGPGYAD